jgi:uncharacterized membrane protein
MSTAPPSSTAPTLPPPGATETRPKEIKLVSHSNLFYWWPVWALAFFMALWTWVEGRRLAIVPPDTQVLKEKDGSFNLKPPEGKTTASLEQAVSTSEYNRSNPADTQPTFKPRMSEDSWLGAVFTIGLLITILITNVPLRGLWSFLVLILIVVVVLFVSLFKAWDQIFENFANLHIHMNMAAYLFVGIAVFVMWALAVFVFDRRSYILFTPGQVRVCEHIGAGVQVYSTYGLTMEKQRDDLFRHYVLGFGSGDLVLRTAGADRHEIKMPNVLGIGWRLKDVEDMLRTVATSAD